MVLVKVGAAAGMQEFVEIRDAIRGVEREQAWVRWILTGVTYARGSLEIRI
jgi:hypothetical protein